MEEQDRQRVVALATFVDEMDAQSVDFGTKMRTFVEGSFPCPPIESGLLVGHLTWV